MPIASLLTRSILAPHTRRAAKATVPLDNIQVAAPCPMSWEKMNGDDRVRHCQECKLNVYNLSDMTRGEAERLIASREGRLCVRFYRRADGTILTRNCPRGLRKQIDRVTRFAGAALSAIMSVSATACGWTAQRCTSHSETDTQAQKEAQIVLTIVDPQGAEISGASVSLNDKNRKVRFIGATRPDGTALISGVTPGRFTLRITHAGFESYSKAIEIKREQAQTLRVALKVVTDTVVVGLVAEPSLVDHDDSSIKTTFSGDFLRQLPLR
jgi:hypothetical protein